MRLLMVAVNTCRKEMIAADDELNFGHARLGGVRYPSGILH